MAELWLRFHSYGGKRSVSAIKTLRSVFPGMGLKEAKQILDSVRNQGHWDIPESDLERFYGITAEAASRALLGSEVEWITSIVYGDKNGEHKPKQHDTPVYMLVAIRPEDNEAINAAEEATSWEMICNRAEALLRDHNEGDDPEFLRYFASLLIDRMERISSGSTFRAPNLD